MTIDPGATLDEVQVAEPRVIDAPDLSGPAEIAAYAGLCRAALADPRVSALVLDLGEPPAPGGYPAMALAAAQAPVACHEALIALAELVATAPKPVVARLAGAVAGPMATVAMAADLRVAGPSLQFGFPEIRLGLLPMGGALRHAAARIGAAPTLAAALSGRMLPAAEAQTEGFVEILTTSEPAAAGVAAQRLVDQGSEGGLRPDRRGALADADRFLAASAAARRDATDEVSQAAVDCVEAALLLPDAVADGIEAETLAALAQRPETSARLRQARTLARLTRGAPRPARVALVGAVAELAPLVATMLGQGLPVTLCDTDVEALREMLEAVAGLQDAAVEQGRMTADERDAAWARIAATIEPEGLAEAEVALASATAARPLLDALPASVTRALIGPASPDPAQLAAIWPSIGAAGGGVVEILAGREIPHEAVRRLCGLAEALGALALRVPPERSLPSLRLRLAWWRAAADCLALGLGGQQLDGALTGLGAGIGPVALARATGEAGIAALIARMGAEGGAASVSALQPLFAPEGQPLAPVPGEPPPLGAAEARDACLAALANEGLRMIADHAVADAETLDLIADLSLTLPADLGGPLLWAERRGGRTRLLAAKNLLRDMGTRIEARFGPEPATFWQPVPGWDERIRAGKGI